MTELPRFKKTVWNYYRLHRRDFPWRRTRNPYRILVSEIMLQQTQASRVHGYYEKFLTRFPTLHALVRAPLRDVLLVWRGLGYNRRAIMLKQLAEIVHDRFRGHIPKSQEKLMSLPGVGPATAGAILAYAFGTAVPFIETNIRRVFIHFFFPNKRRVPDQDLLPLIHRTLDTRNPRDWYYALMDFGSFLGKTVPNPNRRSKNYHQQSAFRGSNREVRGKTLQALLAKRSYLLPELARTLGVGEQRLLRVTQKLEAEGFIRRDGLTLTITL